MKHAEMVYPDEVYCIECGEMVHPETFLFLGHLAYVKVYGENGGVVGVDVDFCEFPSGYAFVAPPEDLPEGWQDSLTPPGEDDLEPEDDEYVPSGDFQMTPTQYVGL